jgi:hypothetical protein
MGDGNPYGVAVVPRTAGDLVAGDVLTCAGARRQAQGPGLSGLNCCWLVVRARGWWCGSCARGRPALLRSAALGLAPGPAT